MSEIIGIHIGGAGVGIGKSFWEIVSEEHDINPDGSISEKSLQPKGFQKGAFNEFSKSSQQKARAIFFDQNAKSIDSIIASKFSKLFEYDFLIKGKSTNNTDNISLWAEGHYGTTTDENVQLILEKTRTVVERTDRVASFQWSFSLLGGTGSGFGTRVLSKISEEYPQISIQTNNVFPSSSSSENVLETYNTVLSIHQLVENSRFTTMLTNEALQRVISKNLGILKPNFDDINFLIGSQISDLTSALRFSGPFNSSADKLLTNLIPFPRMHFFMNGLAPIKPFSEKSSKVESIIKESYKRKNMFFTADLNAERNILTNGFIFRGNWKQSFVETFLEEKKIKNQYVEWIGDNQQQMIIDNPSHNSLSQVINSRALYPYLQKIAHKFTDFFRRKAFLHHQTSLGMDEMEFTEAESNMNDLTSEFVQWGGQDEIFDEDG